MSPGSSAVDADLHLDDVIIAVDGKRVPSEGNEGNIRAFTRLFSEMEPGRQVTLTVRRFPSELTLRATIGQYSSGGASTQPTTQPTPVAPKSATATPTKDVAISANSSHSTWNDVEAGTPVTHPFQSKPGADIPLLSTDDGLAANWVNCMAELPHGGMAFGTRDGLSLWDGAEFVPDTGPAFSGVRGGTVDGNSGLPSNDVQDLLCDSKGRLWVATMYGVCRIESTPRGKWRVLQNSDRNAFARRGMDQSMDVQTLFEASDGTIIMGGRGSAITLIDPKTDTSRLIHSDNEMNHWITGIAEDGRHRLWFSVMGVGVLRCDGDKVEQIHEPWIVGNNLRGLCIDGAGTIWVADGEKGLAALHADGTMEKITGDQLAGGYIERLATDRAGRVWTLSEGGLSIRAAERADGNNQAWQFAGPANGRVMYAMNANDGSWWVSGMGISRSAKLQWSPIKPRAAAVERFKRETEKTFPKIKADRLTAIGADGIVTAAIGEQAAPF